MPPHQPDLAALFADLFFQFRFLSYFRGEDDELFTLHATDHDGKKITVVRDSPENMARAALNRELKKICRACKRELPLHEFGKNACNKDGRLYRCKVCERVRVKEYQARQAAG